MIDLNNVIENDIEYEIYKLKISEIEKYLKTFGKTGFWDIVKNVGGSERRMLRLINEMEKEGIISVIYKFISVIVFCKSKFLLIAVEYIDVYIIPSSLVKSIAEFVNIVNGILSGVGSVIKVSNLLKNSLGTSSITLYSYALTFNFSSFATLLI